MVDLGGTPVRDEISRAGSDILVPAMPAMNDGESVLTGIEAMMQRTFLTPLPSLDVPVYSSCLRLNLLERLQLAPLAIPLRN